MENLNEDQEELQDSDSVCTWTEMPVSELIGPYDINEPIVTAEGYLYLMNNRFPPIPPSLQPGTSFRQAGAPSHYECEVPALLDENVQNLWIGRHDTTPLPVSSTNPSCLHFFRDEMWDIRDIDLAFVMWTSWRPKNFCNSQVMRRSSSKCPESRRWKTK